MREIPANPPDNPNIKNTYYKILADQVIEKLQSRNMNGYWVSTRSEAKDLALSMISDGSTVAQGGSMTLEETGIRDELLNSKKFKFIDPYNPDLSNEEKFQIRRESLLCDVFLCSTNALTVDGVLVNRDGIGNRVCAMAFGPKKVIIISGINKVVSDETAAIERIDTLASPANCIRLNKNTPCKTSLVCSDCSSPDRICSITTLIDWQWTKDRIHVILVGENLGY